MINYLRMKFKKHNLNKLFPCSNISKFADVVDSKIAAGVVVGDGESQR